MDAARALRETGYAVFPSLYPESFLARGRQAIARVYEGLGSPSLHSRGKSHVGGLDEDLERAIDLETLDPGRIRRLTLLIYLDGLSEQTGQLFVLPRTLADPVSCARGRVPGRLAGGHGRQWATRHGRAAGRANLARVAGSQDTWVSALCRGHAGRRLGTRADNVDPTVAAFADRLLGRR